MSSLDIVNSLINHMEIIVKSYTNITHNKGWIESGIKADYDLWIILDGEIDFTINGDTKTATQNDMILIYPQLLYRAECLSEEFSFIFVHFDFKIGNNLKGLNELPLVGFITKGAVNPEMFIRKYWDYVNGKPLSLLALKGYFTILISEIINYQLMPNNDYVTQYGSSALIRLQPVFEYIASNIKTKIMIADLAKLVGMTTKYFITFFSKTVGITPGSYITQAKMEKALNMVNQNSYSIKEISNFLGYSDQYTFSKAFKRHYKVSPSKYFIEENSTPQA